MAQKLQSKSAIHYLTIDLERDSGIVAVDPVRIERILYNLVENAIKYSPGGGEVKISSRRENDALVVSVCDQGPGISIDAQERLFQSFERLDASGVGNAVGIGLGLKVCRTLVEAHGGRIWVESKPGEGSTFFFALPGKTGDEQN